jgi:hypothetical protein
MTPDRFDALVDEVAESLTAGEPRADFTSRVMARIESSGAPRRGWRRAWLLVPLAAAAILAVFVRGPQRTALLIDRGPAAFAAPVLRRATPELAGDSGERRRERAAPHETFKPRDARAPARTPRTAGAAPRSSPYALDPLLTAGIGVTPLTIDRLSTDPIPIDRLDPITSVDVAPLTIDDPQRRQE